MFSLISISCYVLLIAGLSIETKGANAPRSVTHEEIKDALINFMHIIRSNTDKLERHENRERQLGELLKRALSALEKKGRAQDSVLDKILEAQQNMADKLEKIERALSAQEDAAARGAYTVDTIPGQSMITQIETLIDKRIDNDKVKEVESTLSSKIDYLASVVEKLQANAYNIHDRLTFLDAKLANLAELTGEIKTVGLTNREFDDKLDRKLEEANVVLEKTGKAISLNVEANNELKTKLNSVEDKMTTTLEQITKFSDQKGVFGGAAGHLVDAVGKELSDLSTKFDNLSKEAKTISNVESVLIKTADDVLDTKRRLEHGLYQIRTDLGDYVKSSAAVSGDAAERQNDTVLLDRFNGMAETILENQGGAVTNLSSKVESEIAQVWRQIGIMHQQITASGLTLDNLQNDTSHFVKEAENKMDAMSSKLENIQSSIDLVQENNNFLVGRFSLLAHEFNETKYSLALTTTDLKKVLKRAQLQSMEGSPGPHDIDNNTDDNKL